MRISQNFVTNVLKTEKDIETRGKKEATKSTDKRISLIYSIKIGELVSSKMVRCRLVDATLPDRFINIQT